MRSIMLWISRWDLTEPFWYADGNFAENYSSAIGNCRGYLSGKVDTLLFSYQKYFFIQIILHPLKLVLLVNAIKNLRQLLLMHYHDSLILLLATTPLHEFKISIDQRHRNKTLWQERCNLSSLSCLRICSKTHKSNSMDHHMALRIVFYHKLQYAMIYYKTIEKEI